MIRATSHRWLRHLLSAVVAAGSLVIGTAGVASASSIDESPDELIEPVDGHDLVLSSDPPADGSLDAGETDISDVDSAQFSDGEATLVVDQFGAVEECHVAGSVYASCPDDRVPLG